MKTVDVQTRVSVKNVLYATDFSPVTEFASPIAAELARKFGAKVLAVHVRPPQVYGLVPPESWPAIQESADRQTVEQKKHLGRLFRGVENSALLGEGGTWEVISALIKEKEIDLVVIGTHGRRNFGKVLQSQKCSTLWVEVEEEASCESCNFAPRFVKRKNIPPRR